MTRPETTMEYLYRISREEPAKFGLGKEQMRQLEELINNWNLEQHKENINARYLEV